MQLANNEERERTENEQWIQWPYRCWCGNASKWYLVEWRKSEREREEQQRWRQISKWLRRKHTHRLMMFSYVYRCVFSEPCVMSIIDSSILTSRPLVCACIMFSCLNIIIIPQKFIHFLVFLLLLFDFWITKFECYRVFILNIVH